MNIWVVYEEYEEGSRNGEVVCMQGAYVSEQSADAAIEELRREHEKDCGDFKEGIEASSDDEYPETPWIDGWCYCGVGFTQEQVTLHLVAELESALRKED